MDYSSLSDAQLCRALHDADASNDDSGYAAAYALNEICARLGLPPDETEQGLSERANEKVDDFIRVHAPHLSPDEDGTCGDPHCPACRP